MMKTNRFYGILLIGVCGFVAVLLLSGNRGALDEERTPASPVLDERLESAAPVRAAKVPAGAGHTERGARAETPSVAESAFLEEVGEAEAKPVAAARGEEDPWEQYSVNSTNIGYALLNGPLDGRLMLRHRQLNPRDQKIASTECQRLIDWAGAARVDVADLKRMKSDATVQEFRELLDRNAAARHSLEDRRRNLSDSERATISEASLKAAKEFAEALGRTVEEVLADETFAAVVPSIDFKDRPVAWSVQKGTVHSARLTDLPDTAKAADALRAATLDLAVALVGFFARNGCLDSLEASDRVEAVSKELDELLGF